MNPIQTAHTAGAQCVELLYFDGCPNYERYLPRLRQLVQKAGSDARVELRRIESEADAVAARFLGSPSVRVDGRDVEPNAEQRTEYGLQCRIYSAPSGWSGAPPDDWILAAITASRK